MERIIINEVDNTSNVEALSSYDVAYVPGFAYGPEDSSHNTTLNESLYRVPTLVRDKYEFIRLYGPTCPRFEQTQPYPDEFPKEAIKWDDATTGFYSIKVNNFEDFDDVQDYATTYTRIYALPNSDTVDGGGTIRQYYTAEYDTTSAENGIVVTAAGSTAAQAYESIAVGLGKLYFIAPFDQITIDESANPDTVFSGHYTVADITDFSKKNEETYYKREGTEDDPEYTAVGDEESYSSEVTYYVFSFDVPSVTYYTRSISPVAYKVASVYHAGTNYYWNEDGVVQFDGDEFDFSIEPQRYYYEYLPFSQSYVRVNHNQSDPTPVPVKADASVKVYISTFNPSTKWYNSQDTTSGMPDKTTDTYVYPDHTYYGYLGDGVQPMFNGETVDDNGDIVPGDADPGYRYALTLLSLGMPVYYEQMNNSRSDITVSKMYSGLRARFTNEPNEPDYSFDSMGDYNVKFITSGGYPVFEYSGNGLAEDMITMAAKRKDSIALIDHTDNPSRPLTTYDSTSLITSVRTWNLSVDYGTFGAMFTPWYECTHTAVNYEQNGTDTAISNNHMPASLGYLTALAVQLQNYNPWLAVSGVVRGVVPFCKELHTDKPLTNTIADSYQALPNSVDTMAVSINPITYVRNYGYCLWGNRTLRNNSTGTKASSFLNIRSAVSDIKKRLYEASQQTLFEQNTDVTWLNFKSMIMPLLETMVSNYILEDYAITRLFTDPDTGYPVPAYEVMAVIRIQPINSIEVFDLTIVMENTDDFNITTTESEL